MADARFRVMSSAGEARPFGALMSAGTHARCRARACAITLLACVAMSACTEDATRESAQRPIEPAPSPWTAHGGSSIVGVADDALERDLGLAMTMARQSAPAARARWAATPVAERRAWAVKWAAPVRRGLDAEAPAAAAVEYVWVVPVSWTADRIEGVLVNAPRHPIGWAEGDLVGFPPSELADWVHMLDGSVDLGLSGRREGGYTVRVLEAAFGPAGDGAGGAARHR